MRNTQHKISQSEKEYMKSFMKMKLETIQEKANCRCEAVNRKMRRGAIQAISEIKDISLHKAKKIYNENVFEEFHACCTLCCDCHFDRFDSNNTVY